MIIDTHCHLDDERFDDDLDSVIKSALDAGVRKVIIPGADLNDLKKAREISKKYDEIYFACGVHPYCLDSFDLTCLRDAISDEKCVGVGEAGLDYYRLKDEFESLEEIELEKERQKKAFLAQISLAKEFEKPLIIHAREANQDLHDILKESSSGLKGAVFHCFNASKLLLSLESSGFYYGIGGVLTFKNAKNLVEILPQIPLDKIILETDAPYLAPTPHRGKRNEPAFTKLVAIKVAEILGKSVEEIEEVTTQNAKTLFKI